MNPEIELYRYKNERHQLLMVMKIVILICVISLVSLIFCCKAKGEPMDLTRAVIHHTAGNKLNDRDLTIEEIDRYHKSKGWDGIGYHFLIRKDGIIYEGRLLTKQGAHAKGRNHYIGIALTGCQNFTKEQYDSLFVLLNQLDVRHVERHHEFCPGQGLEVENIQKMINIYRENGTLLGVRDDVVQKM